LAARWRALEAASDGGFFRSWLFVAHQAERFSNPHLLAMRAGGEDIGLALLNRRRGRLFLNETGDTRLDFVFVEHNGLLLRRGAANVLVAALKKAAETKPVVLSGVGPAHVQSARQAGLVVEHRARLDPVVDLVGLRGTYLDSLSANARAQIRRSMRLCGPDLTLTRAPDANTALAWFGRLVELHQAAWRRRGKPGAFCRRDIVNFHEQLLRAAVPVGHADILRIAAGPAPIGYLYNFLHVGRVYCYQSGFAAFADAKVKPGLMSHALAIEHYRGKGARIYDLLAGPARYKATLAPSGGEMMHWITLYSRHSLRGRVEVAGRRAWARLRPGDGLNLP
jgi:CelD/BcsL family acetyltransferase involved in cellulose biosynthesis